ncbi:MAG TPA: mechanosensitive ion channel domain-containing protein [Longimicrobium sp.]|nr:mechanosensitive ion channel domain-containing protein [Longimicrobium sp.]
MQNSLDLELLRTRFDEPLFVIGGTAVTVASVISFVVFLVAAYAASWLLRRSLTRVYRRRAVDEGVQHALDRLLHYAVIALGAFVALDNLGVSVTALAGLGAVLAVGIGFGLQNIAQNFVSGLILLLERPVKKGDFVEVGDVRGTVRDIRARATVVTTLDNVDIIVPNGQFITEPVTNETYGDRRVRVRIKVGVAYGSDTARVRDILLRVAGDGPGVLADPPPQVLFREFGESSLDFELLAWLGDPRDENAAASELRFEIDRAFRAEGIEIPFPQRDVHLRSGLPPG